MKLIQISAPGPYFTNTYLLCTQGGHAVIIDPAADIYLYDQALQENHCELSYAFLTHGHFDHVASAQQLRARGVTLYMDPQDAQGNEGYPLTAWDRTYTDGGTITLDELTFTTWHTPGHSDGSWILLCGNLLFSGDTLFAGSIGRTDLPGGNWPKMEQSLKRIVKLPIPDDTQVLPGHEAPSTMGAEKKYNYYLRGL